MCFYHATPSAGTTTAVAGRNAWGYFASGRICRALTVLPLDRDRPDDLQQHSTLSRGFHYTVSSASSAFGPDRERFARVVPQLQ